MLSETERSDENKPENSKLELVSPGPNYKAKGTVHNRLPAGFNPIVGITPRSDGPRYARGENYAFDGKKDENSAENAHATNPFQLDAPESSTVVASFPFDGDESLLQLKFTIGDSILLLKKDEMWSWGKLEKNQREGWFPNNYVQSSLRPLPGIHEMMRKTGQEKNVPKFETNVTENASPDHSNINANKSPKVGISEESGLMSGKNSPQIERSKSKKIFDPKLQQNAFAQAEKSDLADDSKMSAVPLGPILPTFKPEEMLLKVRLAVDSAPSLGMKIQESLKMGEIGSLNEGELAPDCTAKENGKNIEGIGNEVVNDRKGCRCSIQ